MVSLEIGNQLTQLYIISLLILAIFQMTNQTWKEAFANLFQDLLNLIRFYYRDQKDNQ